MKLNNLPPLGPLKSFCAAAKHQSFTKAAQELNLTHGAISRAVQQLEQHFGQTLFLRRNRRIYLTESGRFFADKVTAMLKQLEIASEHMRARETETCISVSCEPSLAMRWLMPRLSHFYAQVPGVEVHLSTAGGPVDLAAQNIDLAIRRSDFQWPADYWVTPLTKERIGPVCHPGYLDKLNQQTAVLLHTRTRPAAWADWQTLSDQEITFTGEQYFDHFYFSLQAAVAGLGIAIGPESLVTDDLNMGHLVAPFGFITTDTDYVALTLKNPQRTELLNSFISWLEQELSVPLQV
ncbi:LysR substrate-binding domain-containing protein [Aliamphritea ceti]|uniref:LysR substrate-binding domain-containing protein n=1 Tax=Aliamphritea ceti TaxID=1524258 RepID=UPI0021C35A5A|nr:LysR substrate-binding domain-containing protein [Aliamphritea ceti]